MGMEKFFTREKASEGRKVFLADPATGLLTKDWLIIRSVWCDEFQAAKEAAVQETFAEAMESSAEEKQALSDKRKLSLVASLVGGWSFDEECTKDNVMGFLREAKQLVNQIDVKAAQDKFFFGKASKDS